MAGTGTTEDGFEADYVVDLTGMIDDREGVDVDGTRSILGTDSPANPFIKDTGYQLFIFNRRTGVMDAVVTSTSWKTSVTVSLNRRDTYDFYVVGNMWFFNSSGTRQGWDVLFSKRGVYPRTGADMINSDYMPYYRFDGASVGSTGLKTETFSQVATYGIPYSGKKEGVTYDNSRSGVSVSVSRLFSKVTLVINHAGLSGSSGTDPFTNSSIHLRQVNCKTHPFMANVSATASDILSSAGDYETNPSNGRSETFVFYVPENCGGTYPSVTGPSAKKPSAAGSKSGTVSYLEFVGKLDADNGGGYGGTLKYQFCLGENDTDDYNVIRNRNYKVTLGFKAGSLFEGADWRLDTGSGLTDRRILGLSADSNGTNRLDETGNQIVALRPWNTSSSKKTLYVFFNHNGGTSNEWSNYIDPYTTGWTPSSAKRSTVKVSCPSMDADGIQYSLNPSTGLLSFWTTKTTGFTTGHEYTITLTLLPGGQTRTFKLKTCPSVIIGYNFNRFYIGMKRTITVSGFCGSNVTVKVKSGGNDILRYANTAGSDKYVTSSGVQLSGSSLPLYAYKNGTLTLNVSSNDPFNDGSFDYSVTVNKPVPYYGDIPHDVPIFFSDGISALADAVMLPFDGTPVDIPVYYRTSDGSRITIGTSSNQFDREVYAQLLDFQVNMSTNWYGREANSFKFYIKSLRGAFSKFFGQYDNLAPEGRGMTLSQSVVSIYPRSTTLFNQSSDKKQTWFVTISPGFFNLSGSMISTYPWSSSTIESNYFNAWASEWSSWKSQGDIDRARIKALWPTIENRINFNAMNCTLDNITFKGKGDHQTSTPRLQYVDASILGVKGKNGSADCVTWKFAPGQTDSGISDTKGAEAPFGKQRITMVVRNIWSGETVDIDSPVFTLKYSTAKLAAYLFGYDWENLAQYYAAAPIVLGWMLYEKSIQPYFDPYEYSTTMPNPLNAFSDSYIICDAPVDLVQYGGINNVQYADRLTSKMEIHAKFPAWKRDSGIPSDIYRYDDATWNADLMQWWFDSDFALPKRYAFTKEGARSGDIPRSWYSNQNLYDYIRFSYDNINTDGVIRRLGYNIY